MKEKIKVLITDDSEMNLKLFEALVKSFGYYCKTAENGQIAYNLISNESFDIILMDIEMPVLNGKEFLTIMRTEKNSIIPVIALTAHKNSEVLNDLVRFGFNDCLVKPFSKNELNNIILKHCEKLVVELNTEINSQSQNDLYNLTYLQNMADNNEELLQQLIETFIKLVPVALKNMKEHYQSGNLEMLYIESHKFSSQLVFIGATQTSESAAIIEKIAKEKSNLHQVPDLINNIEADCKIIISELNNKTKNL